MDWVCVVVGVGELDVGVWFVFVCGDWVYDEFVYWWIGVFG